MMPTTNRQSESPSMGNWVHAAEGKSIRSSGIQMTTSRIDGVAGAALSASIWRDRVGLAAMLSDHDKSDSSEDILDASDTVSLAFAILDTRKRKKVFTGGPDASIKFDRNKRNKHEFSEHSGASSESHSNLVEVFPGKKPLVIMPINCGLSSTPSPHNLEEQDAHVEAVGATVVDSSYGSTDSYNAGVDEYSRGDTSTFNSSEEGSSPQCLHDPFFGNKRNTSAYDQAEKQRDDSWSGGTNLLQFQLGSFIEKERQKLESESEDGSSGLSKHSFSGSWCGYESIEPMTSMHNERLSGWNEHSLSDSLCGYESMEHATGMCHEQSGSGFLSGILEANRSFAESSRAQYHGGTLPSSNTSSMLLSCVTNKKINGFDFPVKEDKVSKRLDTKVTSETEERIILSDTLPGVQGSPFSSAQVDTKLCELHRKFILSSGRLSHVQAKRVDTRVSTIDRDFDDYFAKLML